MNATQRSGWVLMLCSFLIGCAGQSLPSEAPLIPELVGFESASAVATKATLSSDEVFGISSEMRNFVHALVGPRDLKRERLKKLERVVHQRDALGIEYDANATLTVRETFRQKRGNCLSLSLMFAALAREIGIEAEFQEVSVEPFWDQRDGAVFSTRHINVVGRLPRGHYVLDFYMARESRTPRPMRKLSDAEAIAQYYNNIGANALADGDYGLAYSHFVAAIDLAPEVSYFWSNLGVLLNRNGQAGAAEELLDYAVALDSSNVSAYSNLAGIYQNSGREQLASKVLANIRLRQQRNPFFHFAEAEKKLQEGQTQLAMKSIDRAIKLKPDELVFYKYAHSMANSLDDRARAKAYVRAAMRRVNFD